MTNPPNHDAKLWRRAARPYAITDLAFVDGQVYVAGLTNICKFFCSPCASS